MTLEKLKHLWKYRFYGRSVLLCLLLFTFSIALYAQIPDYQEHELKEITVKPKKEKYRKKGNPAYELMQEIRQKAPLYNPAYPVSVDSTLKGYSYDFYEKILLGMNDMTVDSTSKTTGFLKDYQAIAYNTGKPVILLSIKEKIGHETYGYNPSSHKTEILARNNNGIDDAFNQENVNKMLEDVLRNIDVYQNEIPLMQQRFVSPLGNIAGDYYHYHITDTVIFPDDNRRFIELLFSPVNAESFGFKGKLYVADDSTRFIKKVSMRVPPEVNLNYIDNIFITQDFVQDSLGNRHLKLDEMAVEIRIVPGTPSFYARRSSARDNFSYSSPEDDILIQEGPQEPDELWNQMRLIPLSVAEARLAGIHDEIRKLPLFYWGEKLVMIVAKGYIGTATPSMVASDKAHGIDYASKFDIGPVNTLISYNTLEGVRLRVGGMTTGALSQHVFGRVYGAYGFRDHRWKYEVEGEYSFRPKQLHSREFPMHSIRATHRYDVDMLGQHYLFTNADNVFLSWKRKESNLATYQRLSKLEYILELDNNFSVVAGFRHQIQFATRFVPFIDGYGTNYGHFSQSAFFVKLRYAPGEVFYEGRTIRMPINMDAPVFQLTHEFGPKGFLGSRYTVNVTELSVQKRFWLSFMGYADVILKGGKIWSQVDYPSLLWPNANLSYTIQPESYSLMNPMEFANDWYGSLDLTYWLNGLIFNRIPYVKKARLREVFTFKLLSGGLTRKNNPALNNELFRFPTRDNDQGAESGVAEVHTLTKTPYMEIGVGLDNIFTILRVDYVWRLTYRDLPGIDRSGLRVSLHFSF